MSLEHRESAEPLRTELIQQLAHDAGSAILRSNAERKVETKSGQDNFATEADMVSEQLIMEGIRKYFPDDLILSEETSPDLRNPLDAQSLWVIDPLDGTTNLNRGRNFAGVSIAYVEKGKVMAGSACNPFTNELYFAERGKGAFLNNRRIHVSNKQEISRATIITDNAYDPKLTKKNLELLLSIEPTPWIRAAGSAVLTLGEVARGGSDLFFHCDIKPWDIAAMLLIIEEAGGKATDFSGSDITFMSPEIIAGNPELVRQCVERFEKYKQ